MKRQPNHNQKISKLKELIRDSTIHALPNIINTKKKLSKTIWSFFFIVSLIMCCYFTFTKVNEYFDYSVITNINTVSEIKSQFPTVTICKMYDPYVTNFIIDCRFNNSSCYIFKKNRFCYVFNSGFELVNRTLFPVSVENSTKIGATYGLKVTLETTFPNGRFVVYINNHSVNADNIYRKPFSKGVETNLIIKRTFIEKLSDPFSKCQREVVFTNESTQSSYKYFQSECFELCRYFRVANSCNFTSQLLEVKQLYFTDKIAYFDVYRSLRGNCPSEIVKESEDSLINEGIHEVCGESCPSNCDFLYIHIEPRFILKKSLKDNNLAYLNIYYENFEYTFIKEIPMMTSEDLFGHIGGFLGLFLGLSVLSIAEIFEFILIMSSFSKN